MRLTLILLVVLALVMGPMVASITPAVERVAGTTAAAWTIGGDDDGWDLWDWIVLGWTWHWDDWPV